MDEQKVKRQKTIEGDLKRGMKESKLNKSMIIKSFSKEKMKSNYKSA